MRKRLKAATRWLHSKTSSAREQTVHVVACGIKGNSRSRPQVAPELGAAKRALGFSKDVRETHGTTREQRCWMHKAGDVLSKLN